jgi:hypothetical protein
LGLINQAIINTRPRSITITGSGARDYKNITAKTDAAAPKIPPPENKADILGAVNLSPICIDILSLQRKRQAT